jgi:hypothetical protein
LRCGAVSGPPVQARPNETVKKSAAELRLPAGRFILRTDAAYSDAPTGLAGAIYNDSLGGRSKGLDIRSA